MIAPKLWLNRFVDLSGISDREFSEKMTFSGNKVELVHKINGQSVFEFEITSNRPDTLSIIGLAREAAAIFYKKLRLPTIPSVKNISKEPVKLTLTQPRLCPTFSLVEIDQITIKPSSQMIQGRLKLAGIRPVNNVVDITNFLMWETGQPMHAFDADTITGQLNLRAAKAGEVIIPLDHQERKLGGGEIIIEDEQKLVDLAGLMGGLNSEVTEQTKKVLLLVPIYDPVAIRRASRWLNLRSEASTRFEKKIDLTQTAAVCQRALLLIEEAAFW